MDRILHRHQRMGAAICLVLLQVPKYFGLLQIFCAILKNYLHILTVTNILLQTKRWFAFSKIGFCAGTKVVEEALDAFKFLGWLKNFGPAQNILGPIKWQGIKTLTAIQFIRSVVAVIISITNSISCNTLSIWACCLGRSTCWRSLRLYSWCEA